VKSEEYEPKITIFIRVISYGFDPTLEYVYHWRESANKGHAVTSMSCQNTIEQLGKCDGVCSVMFTGVALSHWFPAMKNYQQVETMNGYRLQRIASISFRMRYHKQ